MQKLAHFCEEIPCQQQNSYAFLFPAAEQLQSDTDLMYTIHNFYLFS